MSRVGAGVSTDGMKCEAYSSRGDTGAFRGGAGLGPGGYLVVDGAASELIEALFEDARKALEVESSCTAVVFSLKERTGSRVSRFDHRGQPLVRRTTRTCSHSTCIIGPPGIRG